MKTTNWALLFWEDESGAGHDLYEVEYAGEHKVILKMKNGKLFSVHHCEVDFITEEEATLWLLENH